MRPLTTAFRRRSRWCPLQQPQRRSDGGRTHLRTIHGRKVVVLVLSRTIPDGDRDVDGANPRVGFLIGACVAGHGHRKVRSRAEYAPSAIALTTGGEKIWRDAQLLHLRPVRISNVSTLEYVRLARRFGESRSE